ncbi:glyoxylate bypass operon transcriptional repressor IclR [Pseudonocardia kongjuensis]|uniref:Glyoxylate bypass operon transcriptional repressor IclR n=1 Tax=Pseudonocardia kongjuensis TaxID=102227 RepID=A0ABN1XVX3_9PSEU
MKNRPAYGIDSVDHALRLATLLKQEGPLRVMEAAEHLGVARSTAHRLLAMLVYRDFAEQDDDRRYLAGPALRHPSAPEPVADLRRIAEPHLRELTARTGETTSVTVTVGHRTRFVATVECTQVLRVGDRAGRVLPAHLASGGKAALATLPDDEVRARLAAPDATEAGPVDVEALLRELRRCRRRGYALNEQATESGVTAIGRAVDGPPGAVPAAVAIAMPTVRFRRDRVAELGAELAAATGRIGTEWAVEAAGYRTG